MLCFLLQVRLEVEEEWVVEVANPETEGVEVNLTIDSR